MGLRSDLVAREWPSRPFRVVTGMWALALAGLVIGTVILNLHELGALTIAIVAIPLGVLVPLWMLSLHVTVRASAHELRVAVWPLYRARIPYSSLRLVDSDVGHALRHHGGFVPVAGPREDRALGFSQDSGVRLVFGTSDEVRQISILTDRADELAKAIRQVCARANG